VGGEEIITGHFTCAQKTEKWPRLLGPLGRSKQYRQQEHRSVTKSIKLLHNYWILWWETITLGAQHTVICVEALVMLL